MSESSKQNIQIIQEKLGHKVQNIYSIVWAAQGRTIDWSNGCLEIHFDKESVLFLTVDADGATLLVQSTPWIDPLSGKLDEDTKSWIEETGRYIKVCITTIYPFSEIIGKTLNDVKAIHFENTICGAQLSVGDTYINIITLMDKCDIEWGISPIKLSQNNLMVVPNI